MELCLGKEKLGRFIYLDDREYYRTFMVVTNIIAKWVILLARVFTPKTVGVTIFPFIFFYPPEYAVYQSLLKHERQHLKQWLRYLWIGFPFVYIYQYLRYGYWNMPLEIEARAAEYLTD
jgi:hypothetical protein